MRSLKKTVLVNLRGDDFFYVTFEKHVDTDRAKIAWEYLLTEQVVRISINTPWDTLAFSRYIDSLPFVKS